MKVRLLACASTVISSLCVCVPVQGVISPPSNQSGVGPAASSAANSPTYYRTNNPGDNHGSIGRTYTAFKVNSEIQFVNRSTGAATTYADATFWMSHTNLSLGGAGTINYTTDGRILYDPCPPTACPASGGHWLSIELANVAYTDGTQQEGVLIGVSAGEDPTGSWYAEFDADPARKGTSMCTTHVPIFQ